MSLEQRRTPEVAQVVGQLGQLASEAAIAIAKAETKQKNAALELIATGLEQKQPYLLAENAKDMLAARQNGLKGALLDRLELNVSRVAAMIEGCRQIAKLPDPVGMVSDMNYRPSGIQVGKMRVPLGVIGIIYESRTQRDD